MGQPFAHIRVRGAPSIPGGMNCGAGVRLAGSSSLVHLASSASPASRTVEGCPCCRAEEAGETVFPAVAAALWVSSSAPRGCDPSTAGARTGSDSLPWSRPAFARRCGPPPSRQGARACRRPAEGPDRRSSSSPLPLRWSGLSRRSSAPRSATVPAWHPRRAGHRAAASCRPCSLARGPARRTWPARPCRMRRSSWVSITSIVRSAPSDPQVHDDRWGHSTRRRFRRRPTSDRRRANGSPRGPPSRPDRRALGAGPSSRDPARLSVQPGSGR